METQAHQPVSVAELRALVARARQTLSASPENAAAAAADVAARAAAAFPEISVEARLLQIEGLRRLNRTSAAISATLDALQTARRLPDTSALLSSLHRWHVMLHITEERAVLALAAAGQALRRADRCTAADADLYAAVAMAYALLGDIDRGRTVMDERVLPMALAANDPEAINLASARMAGLLHVYACAAAGIEHVSLLYGRIGRNAGLRRSLGEANAALTRCERVQSRVSLPGRCFYLAMAGLVESLHLGIDAGRQRFEAGLRLADALNPRSRLLVLTSYGQALRSVGHHHEAVSWLDQADALAVQTGDKVAECETAYELGLCYRALDKPALARAATATHERLHAQRSLAAVEWSTDPRWLALFGAEPDLDALRRRLLTAARPAALARADAYISANLSRRLPVSEIAHEVGASVRTLQSLYRRYEGWPVNEVVRRRRMSLARQLLSDGQLSVARVAELIGYSAPANFSRDFKTRYGVSPAASRGRTLTPLDELLTFPV